MFIITFFKFYSASSEGINLDSLQKHYRLILELLQYRLRTGDVTNPYAIENRCTINVEDTISYVPEAEGDG